MEIICIQVSLLDELVYFYYDPKTLDAVIIDPGSEANKIEKVINDNLLNLRGVLLTHGHVDHISAISELRKRFDFKLYAHEKELPVLTNENVNLSSHVIARAIKLTPDVLLKDDQELSLGSINLKVVNTPGHTPGSCCYINKEDKVVFTGDTLFYESIGRCDLPLSDYSKIKKAIKNKLFSLDDDYKVYPGHDKSSTIGHEKKYNFEVK